MTNPARANFDSLIKVAEGGDVSAQYEVANGYFKGTIVEKNSKRAFEWTEKSANKGNHDAQYLLGTFYQCGYDVVAIDQKESVKWFTKAAEKGHAPSQCALGLCYRDGDGVVPSKESDTWLQKSASQGYPYAVLNVVFGKITPSKLTDEDAVKAFENLLHDANAGDPNAMFRVGVSYTQARGVTQDYDKAIQFLQKAAMEGHALAINNLGVRYVKGDGIQKDLVKAVELFRKASAQNNANAYNNLAVRYLKGEAVPQNMELAQQYFKKAADLGNIQSQINLGDSYRNGDRFRKSLRKAKHWYELAANNGNAYSSQQIDSPNFKNELQKEIEDANNRWKTIRLFFIASLKNKTNQDCSVKSVPVEILKIIVRYADL